MKPCTELPYQRAPLPLQRITPGGKQGDAPRSHKAAQNRAKSPRRKKLGVVDHQQPKAMSDLVQAGHHLRQRTHVENSLLQNGLRAEGPPPPLGLAIPCADQQRRSARRSEQDGEEIKARFSAGEANRSRSSAGVEGPEKIEEARIWRGARRTSERRREQRRDLIVHREIQARSGGKERLVLGGSSDVTARARVATRQTEEVSGAFHQEPSLLEPEANKRGHERPLSKAQATRISRSFGGKSRRSGGEIWQPAWREGGDAPGAITRDEPGSPTGFSGDCWW